MKNQMLGALALSAAFASPAAAKEIDITATFGESTQQVAIDCERLGNPRNPGLSTLTQLDSMVHGYEGDVYLDETAREAALEGILENFARERHTMVRDAFNRQFSPFDNAANKSERINLLARKLALHDIDIGSVLRECAAP